MLVSFDFEFCLDRILLESTKKVCKFLEVNYNVGAPSSRIHGQANATNNRYQLSNEFADQSDSKEITLE